MTYAPETDPRAVLLNLSNQYSPPTNPAALNFDLADQQGGPTYRKPPLAVSYQWGSEQTSQTPGTTVGHWQDQGSPLHLASEGHDHQQATVLALWQKNQPWSPVPSKDHAPEPHSGRNGTPLAIRPDSPEWDANLIVDAPEGTGAQGWDVQPAKDRAWFQPYIRPPAHNVSDPHTARDTVVNWQAPPPKEINLEQDETLNLQVAPYTPPGSAVVDFEMVPDTLLVEVKPPTRSVDSQPDIPAWSLKEALDGRTIHPWDRKPRIGTEVEHPSAVIPDPPISDPPPAPENKRTYFIMNSSSLVEVTTGTPLNFKDLSIELDADSFAWKMRCTINNRASMSLIKPSSEGPAEVIATVNGYEWRFVIGRYSRNKQFAKESYTVTGFSRSQLLAEPYAPRRTGRIETQTTMMQAIAEQLQFTGFTASLQEGLYDFVIPAGAWGWEDKTAMQVITELADALGAVVVPDREQDVLHIRHRYRQIGPWDYDALTEGELDTIIQDTMVTSDDGQWEPQPDYNAVFVSGITDGVSVNVIRTGTPGDKPAPDNFHDLNVEAYQCRLRGLSAIAAGGEQEIVTIGTALPTSGSPGLIEPAMLAECRATLESEDTWRGNVLSNSISVSKPGTGRVTQNVKIERHYY